MKAVLFEKGSPGADRLSRRRQVPGGAAFGLSLLLHLLVICVFLFGVPACEPEREASPEVMMVSLLGDSPGPARAPEPAPTSEPGLEAESEAIDEPPPPPLPKGDTLSSVPEGDGDSGDGEPAQAPPEPPPLTADREDLNRAARPEESPLGPQPRSQAPEMERRRAAPPEVSPPEVQKRDRSADATPGKRQLTPYEMMTRSLGRDARILGGAQGQADPLASRYYSLIIGRIDRRWSPLTRNSTRRLEAFYNIVIEPDGRISSARRVRSSGDADFDRSVEQALRQSSPLPPPPSVFGGRRLTVPLVFNHDRRRN